MSWCDKLASTPTIGFGLEPHFRPASLILDAMAPLLDPQMIGGNQTFSLDKQEAFDLRFTLREGFQYSISPNKTSVAFTHRLEIMNQSAGAPVAKLLTEAKPYTKLLPEVAERLVGATSMIPGIERRKVERVGVISTTVVSEEEMPPGIQCLIERSTQSWGAAQYYSLQVVCKLVENDEFWDRCIHTVTKSEVENHIPTLNFVIAHASASGFPASVRRMASKAPIARRRAVSTTERMSA